MGIFKNIKNSISSKKVPNGNGQELEEFLNWLGIKKDGISDEKLNSDTYYACMLIRCNAMAKLPLKLYVKDKKGGARKAEDHGLYNLLKLRPNPYMTMHDFLWATEFDKLYTGNAYWYLEKGNKGEITNIWLLDARYVTVFVDNVGIVGQKNAIYYKYQNGLGQDVYYLFDEICHFKNFPRGGIVGTSVQNYIKETVEREQHASKFISKHYKTGLMNPIIVQYAGDLNETKKKAIQEKFMKMGGTENAGKVLPIPPQYKLEQLKTSLVDNQFFQLQGLTSRHIANAFGVKSFQLNDLSKSTYSNITEQNKAFYSDTLQNTLTEYEQEIDYKALSEVDRAKGFFSKFNVDVILRGNLKERMEAYEIAARNGFMEIKEIRDREDLSFIEGTDILIIGNGASIPLKDLGKQYKEKSDKGGD